MLFDPDILKTPTLGRKGRRIYQNQGTSAISFDLLEDGGRKTVGNSENAKASRQRTTSEVGRGEGIIGSQGK